MWSFRLSSLSGRWSYSVRCLVFHAVSLVLLIWDTSSTTPSRMSSHNSGVKFPRMRIWAETINYSSATSTIKVWPAHLMFSSSRGPGHSMYHSFHYFKLEWKRRGLESPLKVAVKISVRCNIDTFWTAPASCSRWTELMRSCATGRMEWIRFFWLCRSLCR